MDKLLYFISGISAISVIVIWIGKLIINKSFDLGIEKYKSSLQKDIEDYKNNLAKQSLEHQVMFSKLHSDRAEIIKVLFIKVVELEKALIHSTTIFQGPEFAKDRNRDLECIKANQELIAQIEIHRIYFTIETIAKFEKIIQEAWSIINEMSRLRSNVESMDKYIAAGWKVPEVYMNSSELWNKTFERTQKEFRELKESLADDFRKLIGI